MKEWNDARANIAIELSLAHARVALAFFFSLLRLDNGDDDNDDDDDDNKIDDEDDDHEDENEHDDESDHVSKFSRLRMLHKISAF